jgi:hypothetical protein
MPYKNSPESALPGDRVRLSTGEETGVNSAHYLDVGPHCPEARQMFSVFGKPHPDDGGPLFYADESELLHRCVFRADPVTKIRRCECGHMPAVAYLYGPYAGA